MAGAASLAFLLASCGGGSTPAAAIFGNSTASADSGAAMRAAQQPLRAGKLAAATPIDNASLFTWAQWHYPQYFPATQGFQTGTYQIYSYRYYPSTGHYLATGTDGHAYVMGPATGYAILDVGAVSSFQCQVLPAGCPVTATPTSPTAALSGFYYDTLGLLLIAADGTFVGFNPNVQQTRSDLYTGTATVQGTSWSATGATYGSYTPGGQGAARGSADITGTFSTNTALTATFAVTGTNVTPVSSRVVMDYHPQSTNAASLFMAGGQYLTPSQGQNILIDAGTGAVSGNLYTGCAVAGTLGVPDGNRNIYKAALTLTGANCPIQGAANFLAMYYDNGVQDQELLLYGTSTGSVLDFVYLTFYRNGDGV
jgi:hypothetical protein